MSRREHLADYVTARERLAELEDTFDLRWAADMRAIKQWRVVHPEKPMTWPDHADLVVWLAEEHVRLLALLADAHETLVMRGAPEAEDEREHYLALLDALLPIAQEVNRGQG